MPYPDTVATYTYYLTQIASMKIAYVQLGRYMPPADVPLPPGPGETGSFKRGTPHDVLAVYGPIIKPPVTKGFSEKALRGPAMPDTKADSQNPTPTRLFLNAFLTPSEAEKLLAEGKIDAAVFGTLWLGNPDLQKRLEKGMDVGGKGVNDQVDFKTFHGAPGVDPRKGYTDYPTAM